VKKECANMNIGYVNEKNSKLNGKKRRERRRKRWGSEK